MQKLLSRVVFFGWLVVVQEQSRAEMSDDCGEAPSKHIEAYVCRRVYSSSRASSRQMYFGGGSLIHELGGK